MTDDDGKKIEQAGPSVPVEIIGLAEVPGAGDIFDAVDDEKMARELVEQRKDKEKEERNKLFHKVTLDNLFDSIQQGEMKELNIIVKADVQARSRRFAPRLRSCRTTRFASALSHGRCRRDQRIRRYARRRFGRDHCRLQRSSGPHRDRLRCTAGR